MSSSSSGGSDSTASLKEGAMDAPTTSPSAAESGSIGAPEPAKMAPMTNGDHQSIRVNPYEESQIQMNGHHEDEMPEDDEPDTRKKHKEHEDSGIKETGKGGTENRMASVITINGTDATIHDSTANSIVGGKTRPEKTVGGGFDNAGFVDDEAHTKGKVVNGGGVSPPTSSPPRPPSPAGPFLNSAVPMTPTHSSGGANGRGPVMETPNSNLHNNSGLIMTPSEKEKGDLDGSANVTEAVNLELVNMNPYGGAGLGVGEDVAGGKSGTNGGLNGIPVKRGVGDEETGDGGFGDPYDEYFVPVNEHRKYMRGEKLYVTKDRRRSQSWRRCICWGIGFTLLAVAILIAVLAGTGVILSQEPEGAVEGRGFSSSHPHVAESKDPKAPVEKSLPPSTSLPPEPSSSFTPPPIISSVPVTPPTTEMSGLYVPRVLEAEMRIDSLEYSPDLANSSSLEFQRLAADLEGELKMALFDHHTMTHGPADLFVKITSFLPGSVMSKFHVGWRFKDSFVPSSDPIDSDSLRDRLEAHLLNNGGYLYTYHISSGSVKAKNVMDLCQIDNGGCSHECRYDYEDAKFMCNCPPGLYLDQTEKKCTTELIEDTMTVSSTEGPKFDEGPWMPMEPEEHVFTAEVAKPSESSQEDDEAHEHVDHHSMHEDHFHTMHATDQDEPAESSKDDEQGMHDSMGGKNHEIHVVEPDVESHEDHSEEPEGHEVHEVHHNEHEVFSSVGRGMSSEDDMAGVFHPSEKENSSEESHEGHDVNEHVEEEKITTSEGVPPTNGDMDKFSHSVDSSENTSEEEHDSGEMEDSHKKAEKESESSMSEGEKSDGSSSNELHSHILLTHSETTSSETSTEKSKESLDDHDHHLHHIETDMNTADNETGHENNDGPLKGDIVSAVEHVVVKDEDKTVTDSEDEDVVTGMNHDVESSSAGHESVDESDHGLHEIVGHVTMEGEHESTSGNMEDTSESIDKPEEEMPAHVKEQTDSKDHEHEHSSMGVGEVGVTVVGSEENQESSEEKIKNDTKMEEKEAINNEDMGVNSPDGSTQSMPEDKDTSIMEDHDPSTVTVQNINYVINHEDSHMPSENNENSVTPVEADSGVNDGSSANVNNATEVTFGEDEHKTDFTSMNHEKSENEEEIKKRMESNDGLEHNAGEPITLMVEGTGESKDDVGMEETTAAVIENETDINSDKPTVKEGFEEETAEKDQGKDSNAEDVSQDSVHSVDGAVTEGMPKNNPENESEEGEAVHSMKDGAEEAHVLDDSEKEKDSTDQNDNTDAIAAVKPSDEESATAPTAEETSEGMNEAMDGSKSDEQDSEDQAIAFKTDEELGKNDVLVETPVSEKEVISEYDDPNIVPVEETPKETIDITDGKKMPFYPDLDVRIDGGSEAEKTEDMEVTTMKQGLAETPVIDFMSPVIPSTESDNHENASGKAVGHEMEMVEVTSSSTSSPSENSIENLSDHYNSTDTINHISPTAENDLSAIPRHFVIPVITNNESSTAITTPSPKENNIDDPPLHIQAGIPLMVSEAPSSTEPATITTKQATENDLSSLDYGGQPSEEKSTKEDEITIKNIAELDNLEKIIDETAAKLEAEVGKDSSHDLESSSDSSVKKDSEKQMTEEGMKDAGEKPIVESVDTLVGGSERDEPVTKEDSISTVNQDFILDHANTVHATSPTSPSTIEEPAKEDSVSETPILESVDTHSLEGSVTKDAESKKPDPLIPFDDNERSNNLATLDNEGLVTLPEEGKDPLVKVGAVDLDLKSTTEHTNEIAIATLDHKNWPATALEVHNVTDGVPMSNTNEEGNQMNVKEPKSKTDSFEIPMKKKVDFKKPTHHEDDTFKPLFFKEGKESLNKVDKIGLLPASPAMKEEPNMDVVSEEEVDGLPIATTEEPMEEEKSSVSDGISTVETSVTPISTLGDKGGERLNAISEDDSGKDTGKPVTKESVKEIETGVTMKSETTKDGDSLLVEVSKEKDEQEMKVEDKMDEQNGMTEAVTDSLNIVSVEPEPKNEDEVDKLDDRKGDIPEDTTKIDESNEMPTTVEPMKEEVTTMSMESETVMPAIFSEERMNKGIDEVDVGKMTEKMNSEEESTTVINDSVANTVVTPIEVHKKMEEMLKEMGGFGEGGHKVVAKTGVETDIDVSSMESSTEKMDVSSTTPTMSSTMEPSSTVEPPPSSSQDSISITSVEQDPTTMPPVDEVAGMEEKKDEVISRENAVDDLQSAKNDTMSTSEDPIPTMMVHEIMTESPHSSSPATVEVSSEQNVAPVVNENPEISSSTVVSEGDMTTVTPESVTEPEILVKEETSNVGGDGDVKEVKTTTASEAPMESSSLESRANNDETEKNHIEGEEVVSNVSISEFPDLDQQFFSKCTAGQFQCTNGTSLTPHSVMPISSSSVTSVATGVACVPLSAKCDSINDCSDGSDELGCIEEGCPGNFQCSNGQCLKRHLVCNGIVDCNDGSDEASCDKWQCQFDEFQCPSGRCIPILWLCDGKPDCDNHTDEYNCQDSCGNDEYLCPERWCIPMSWRCNGVPECANGEDEKLCDCSLEQVKCGTGGCVARSEICDGVEQCPDQSDEWGCVQLHNETMKLEVRNSDNQWLPVCADRWDNNWSNFVCQSFGYSRSVFTEYPTSGDLDGTTDVFMLKPGASIVAPPGNGMRLPGVLQQASSSLCSSGSIVEISCQEYTCGNHGLADGVAARLVGGDEAANGQWPSVALLYHTRQRATCTASIISPRWLIASYNCLHMREKSLSPDGWVAFGGGSTFDKDKPETQIKNVRSIVPYPQVKYNRFLYNHDVALVELMEPLSFTRSVGAICLPDRPIEPRQLCVTAGWGYTSPGEINFSQYLHYLPVPTIDLKECNSTKHYSGFITEDKICAGFTDAMHSPCYNDEGAPLMCVSEGGIWELQGVLSYHSNCGRGYHPSIFSSVTAVRDWVKRVVGGRFERRSTFNVRRRRRTKRRRSLVVWT